MMKPSLRVAAVLLCAVFVLVSPGWCQVRVGAAAPRPAMPGAKHSPARRYGATTARPQILFDDFSYSDRAEFVKNGWVIRASAGWPGVPGAVWRQENVSFLDDPDELSNRVLRMTS